MTNHFNDEDKEKEQTAEAWGKLQQKLAHESRHAKWMEWDRDAVFSVTGNPAGTNDADNEGILTSETEQAGQLVAAQSGTIAGSPMKDAGRTARRKGMSRGRKWAVAAAGVAIFGTILATPIGNTAMASILNQFRVQEVAVVNEADLQNLFYQVTQDGDVNESMNKFGTFSSTNSTVISELPIDKVQETLGYGVKEAALMEGRSTVMVGSSQDITLNLNVDEVNKALQRLGAEHLLPESVDGKPITLHIPEIVNYDLSSGDNKWASLTQMNTPVLNVDPSIKVEEALESVINFPLLPEHLKSTLLQSRILSGEIPLPLIAGANTEQINVGSTSVIVDHYDYNQGPVYNAIWIQNGQLFNLSGEVYSTKEKLVEKVKELIES